MSSATGPVRIKMLTCAVTKKYKSINEMSGKEGQKIKKKMKIKKNRKS